MSLLWMLHVGLVCAVFFIKSKADEEQENIAVDKSASEGSLHSYISTEDNSISVEGR